MGLNDITGGASSAPSPSNGPLGSDTTPGASPAPGAAPTPGSGTAPGAGPAGTVGAPPPPVEIRLNDVVPSETSGMDVHSVMRILRNLDVAGVREAAAAHQNLGETLDRTADNLVVNANTLAGSWQGQAAQAAVTKFHQMHGTTAQLAAQARQTAQVLHWTADVMEQYRNLPTPAGDSAAPPGEHSGAAPGAAIGDVVAVLVPGAGHHAKADAQAQRYLNALNQHLVTANNALPAQIGPTSFGTRTSATHRSGGAVGGPGLSPYGGAGSGSAAPGFGGASLPHGGAGSPGSLQSAAMPPGGTATLPPPGTTVSGGATGPAGVPGMMPSVPVPGSATTKAAEEEVSSDDVVPVTDDGAELTGYGNSVTRTEHTEHRDTGKDDSGNSADAGAMAGGPGVGQPDGERHRGAWMNEDTDIWGVPKATVGSMIDDSL